MNIRLAAAKTIYYVVEEGQSLTAALEQVISGLSSTKDRALIQAICYGTLRYYHRLNFILGQLLRKPIKDKLIKSLALVGLYQLGYMRIKDYAAVSETVAAANKKPWAKGLLNALFRNYLRHQSTIESLADKNKIVSCCHPEWMIDAIANSWPDQVHQILAENMRQPPMVLRVNNRFCTRDSYNELLQEHEISASVSDLSGHAIILDTPMPVDQLPEFMSGWVSVQDTAAQLAAELLNAQPGQRVLDVCAAPGGKTAHILELEPELEQLMAVDIDKNRLLRVADNLKRLQLHAECRVGDASQPDDWWDGRQFDRILLDAPCSAMGVIRRHPDIKLLRRQDDIERIRHLQQSILDSIWPLLKPGGILLYATCSILKQENQDQIMAFLERKNDAKERSISGNWGIEQKVGRQILTGEKAMDGFYYARLTKY